MATGGLAGCVAQLGEPWGLRFMNHHDFAFDDTFGETANNADVYEGTAQQLVLDALEGKQGTVMMPPGSRVVLSLAQVRPGSIYEQAAEDIFYGAHGKCVTATLAAAAGYYHWLMGTKAAARLLGYRLSMGQLQATSNDTAQDNAEHNAERRQAGLWNKDAAPRQRVKRYDCLRLVNGVGNNSNAKELVNMVAACRGPAAGNSMQCQENCWTLELDVIRNGCKLGLAVAASKSDLGLLVRGAADTEHSLNTLRHACIMDGQGQAKSSRDGHAAAAALCFVNQFSGGEAGEGFAPGWRPRHQGDAGRNRRPGDPDPVGLDAGMHVVMVGHGGAGCLAKWGMVGDNLVKVPNTTGIPCSCLRSLATGSSSSFSAMAGTVKCGTLCFQPLGVGTNKWGTDPAKYNLSNIKSAFETSLSAGRCVTLLNTAQLYYTSEDCIGLAGNQPYSTPEAMADQLAAAYQRGLVKNVGVSNYDEPALRQMHQLLKDRGVPLVFNEIEFSLLRRLPETNGLLKELDVTVLAWAPLASGRLTCKPCTEQLSDPQTVACLEQMRILAERHKKTVALNWCICKGTVPIPGARTLEQAQENAGALGWQLSTEEVAQLDAVAVDSLGMYNSPEAWHQGSKQWTGFIVLD
eukprot:Skav205426  [mRNA]  locus=scaffold582:428576:455034:- [translate_table: standard]